MFICKMISCVLDNQTLTNALIHYCQFTLLQVISTYQLNRKKKNSPTHHYNLILGLELDSVKFEVHQRIKTLLIPPELMKILLNISLLENNYRVILKPNLRRIFVGFKTIYLFPHYRVKNHSIPFPCN